MVEEQPIEMPQALVEPPAEAERPPAQTAEIEALRANYESEVTALKERLALAVAKYRAQLLSAAPEVPEEMVAGDSVEAVDAAFGAARDLVERVRRKLEAQTAQVRIPAGAPARGAADLSGLSPREKIAHALSREAR